MQKPSVDFHGKNWLIKGIDRQGEMSWYIKTFVVLKQIDVKDHHRWTMLTNIEDLCKFTAKPIKRINHVRMNISSTLTFSTCNRNVHSLAKCERQEGKQKCLKPWIYLEKIITSLFFFYSFSASISHCINLLIILSYNIIYLIYW